VVAVFLAGIASLVGLLLLIRWYAYAEPQAVLRIGKTVLVVVGAAIVVGLAVTGRLGGAIVLATVLAPLIMSAVRTARQARNYARMSGMPGAGTSRVETPFLRMALDMESGDLDGEVIDGPFAGRRLSTMSQADLRTLWTACRAADPPSARILEAYLDRHHDGWRDDAAFAANDGGRAGEGAGGEGEGARSDTAAGVLSREQAYRVLGLEPGANDEAVRNAHHRLITLLHPDRGGSSVLAAQVNRARDVLLKTNP
jgi:hypothetical protein